MDQISLRRTCTLGDEHWNLPFCASFAYATSGNLRTENDPPLSSRFSPTSALLITCACWKQQNRIHWFDEHVRAEHYVLGDSHWYFRERITDVVGFGKRFEKVASALIEPVNRAIRCRIQHLNCIQTALRLNSKSPMLVHLLGTGFVHRNSAWELIRNCTD